MRYPLVKGGRSRFGGTSGVLLYGFIAWRNCSKSSMDALRTCGTTNKTAAAHSHMAIETISARRWVTMMWYRKANLTAMDRSKLIKARWRMITDMRRKMEHELMFLRMQDQCPSPKRRFKCTTSRTDGMASNPSAMDKLAKITFDAVRRLWNLWNAQRMR